jgi:hypothetical protein
MAEACEIENGTFSEDFKLPIIREEMQKVAESLKGLLNTDGDFKQAASELQTDHLMILRQTKVDPESDKLLTKYVNVNSLVGTEQSVQHVHLTLNPFLNDYSFTKEWNMSVFTD